MLNRCEFIGNLGRDPEIRTTQDGTKIANLSLAVTEKWKSKEGERREKTEWVRVVIFNDGLVNLVENYLRKGSKIFIAGSMATRKWTDQQGAEKYSTEVILQKYRGELTMLDGKQESVESRGGGSGRQEPQSGGGVPDLDDSIPFAPLRLLP